MLPIQEKIALIVCKMQLFRPTSIYLSQLIWQMYQTWQILNFEKPY